MRYPTAFSQRDWKSIGAQTEQNTGNRVGGKPGTLGYTGVGGTIRYGTPSRSANKLSYLRRFSPSIACTQSTGTTTSAVWQHRRHDGHTLVDRAVYTPHSWSSPPQRCKTSQTARGTRETTRAITTTDTTTGGVRHQPLGLAAVRATTPHPHDDSQHHDDGDDDARDGTAAQLLRRRLLLRRCVHTTIARDGVTARLPQHRVRVQHAAIDGHDSNTSDTDVRVTGAALSYSDFTPGPYRGPSRPESVFSASSRESFCRGHRATTTTPRGLVSAATPGDTARTQQPNHFTNRSHTHNAHYKQRRWRAGDGQSRTFAEFVFTVNVTVRLPLFASSRALSTRAGVFDLTSVTVTLPAG
jgi:hypothetical protein